MAKKTPVKRVAKKRAVSTKKAAPQTKHHVPPAPQPRRKVDGVWRWYTQALVPVAPLTTEELSLYGLKNG